MTESNAVLTETRGRVLLITLNRPEAMNAINTDLAQGLLAAVEELDSDDGLTAGVLTGNGRGFCSGMDLKAFAAGGPPKGFDQFLETGSKKPLIAAIEGFALAGGLEVALTCDLLVAAKDAKIGIREVKVGLFAAAGGVFRLPAWVGYSKAMEMALTGEPITAEEAMDAGMLSALTEPEDVLTAAVELAERIAENAPLAVASVRATMRAGLADAVKAQTDHEFVEQHRLQQTADHREGVKAVAERRPGNFIAE